jgi:hypothetical protein
LKFWQRITKEHRGRGLKESRVQGAKGSLKPKFKSNSKMKNKKLIFWILAFDFDL